ncbi:hypothetical protein Hdeb2414_s0021g00580211 [Helianthus debilis subsp. tardiflorus]
MALNGQIRWHTAEGEITRCHRHSGRARTKMCYGSMFSWLCLHQLCRDCLFCRSCNFDSESFFYQTFNLIFLDTLFSKLLAEFVILSKYEVVIKI